MSDIVKRPDGVARSDNEALDAAIGVGSIAAGVVGLIARGVIATSRPIGHFVLSSPLIPGRLNPQRMLWHLVERGRRERALRTADAQVLLEEFIPKIISAVLDQLDLTALVRDRVDLNALTAHVDIDAIAARLDLDEVASRLDIEAIIGRIDMVSLVEKVMADIDLPEVIRESTGSMGSEVVRGVRMQSIQADKAITGIVDRILRRRRRIPESHESPNTDNGTHTPTDVGQDDGGTT
ncbi:MAG: hypothetical protein H0T78_10880 [Longispora sp.]|nr:hypothetical protein [Longispora sp. (in: high G+C Gram-positive bacteria)]